MYLTKRDLLEAEHTKLCNLLKESEEDSLLGVFSKIRATVELTHDLLEMEENN